MLNCFPSQEKEQMHIKSYKFRKHLQKLRQRYSTKAQDNDLDGYCAICSFHIWKLLSKLGHKPKFALIKEIYSSHCYVICQDYLIDITARQFGKKYPKICVRKHNKNGPWFWSNKKTKIASTKE